jgi:uncharacterized protein YfiM (DUF2279 family)
MHTCLLAICLSMSHASSAAPRPVRDAWFGEDKWKHYFVSFVATSLAASGARAVGASHRTSLAVGAGAGTAVGVLKELDDRRHPGSTPSFRDLAWDLAGVGTGVALSAQDR